MQGGTKFTVAVLAGAVVLGVGVGAVLSKSATSPATPAVEQKVETIAPPVVADPADSEWASRGETQGSAGSAPAVAAVSASFSYCKWGGGRNCVVDGDTFWIGGQKVRIAGIDAPETHDYRCASELELGERAARQLQALLNSGAVTMTSIDRDRDPYGRLLRNVSVNGQDVGEALISSGVARAYAGGRRSWCG